MQKLLEIGIKCIREGKPENIGPQMYAMISPELEKLRLVGREDVYQYASKEHIPCQLKTFTQYCRDSSNL